MHHWVAISIVASLVFVDFNARSQQLVDERVQQMMLAPHLFPPPPVVTSTKSTANTSFIIDSQYLTTVRPVI